MAESPRGPIQPNRDGVKRSRKSTPATRPAANPAAGPATGPGGNGNGPGPAAATVNQDPAAPDLLKEAPGIQVETVSVSAFDAPPFAGDKDVVKGKEVFNLATILLTVLDSFAVAAAGDAAAMKGYEKTLIQPPLERILEKYNVVNNALVSQYMDPVLLAMGLVAWGSRVSRLASKNKPEGEKEKRTQAPTPAQVATPTPVTNPGPSTLDIGAITAAPDAIINSFRSESL
jgi:hypothetical protein